MTPRSAINFFRSPIGAFSGFCALVLVGLIVANGFKHPGPQRTASLVTPAVGAEAKPQIVETVKRDMQPFNPPQPKPDRAAADNVKTGTKQPELPPISLFADTPTTEPKPLSKNFAPYGRLIPCELIITVDSSTIRTPIIGLVTEDIYFGGRLLVPAGTEVHGQAQTDRVRERIASSGGWTFVWQDGRELRVSGIALDRKFDPDGSGWGITDGSAGLRGRVLKTDDLAEIKLFAASFLSSAASALTENQQTVLGTEVLPTVRNAGLGGMQGVLQTYAQQIYDSIQRDGFYVRVPAGKQFYLYVTQTIDRNDATIGGSRAGGDAFDEVIPATPPPNPHGQAQQAPYASVLPRTIQAQP
jgi:hypothetical protein